MDPADVHGTRRPVRHHHDGGHGLQDDGQARASGHNETVQTAGCVACAVLVVPSGRYGYGRQRQQLVLPGLPVLHPELHRVVHPRPLSGGSRANQRQVRGSAGTHLCQGHDVHQPTGAGGRGPYRNIRPEPDRGNDGTDRRGRSDQHGERRGQAVVHLADLRHRRGHRQNHHAHRPCGVPYRVVGDDIFNFIKH